VFWLACGLSCNVKRVWNGISLKRPRLSYSVTVGIFPSLRATAAQSSSTVDSCCRKPDPLGRTPAFSSAPLRPPKCLCSASSETCAVRRSSLRVGLCLSFLGTRTDGLEDFYSGHGFLSWEGFSGNTGAMLQGQNLGVFCDTGMLQGPLRLKIQRPITRI